MKTLFFGGSVNAQLNSYTFTDSTTRSSFINKMVIGQSSKFSCMPQSNLDSSITSFMTAES